MRRKMFFEQMLATFFLLLSASTQTEAQNTYKDVSIVSPTAASLAKYADFPVSNHTGIPQISIPIYTVKEGPLQIPISLSYHAGGLKLSELASWVGTGWALNAGGVITRTVRGLPDERNTAAFSTNEKGHLSDGGYNNYIMMDESQSPLTSQESAINYKIGNGIYDGEPDLFFFNLAGYTGKFYFHDDGRPVVVPEQDIRITYDYTPETGNSINSFVITTPDGTKYNFGKTAATGDVDPIEKTHTYDENSYTGTNNIITSWFLNKISSADDEFSITLTYVAEEYKYISLTSFSLQSTDLPGTYDYGLLYNWFYGVRLSSIIFSNGVVNFDAGDAREDLIDYTHNNSFTEDVVNTHATSLGAIRITETGGSFCKKFNFTYSYFNDATTALPPKYGSAVLETDRKRLRLDKIEEGNCTGTHIVPAHQFAYFANPPRRLCLGQDHWGFINGKNTNSTLIPTYIEENNTVIKKVEGANRDAYWPAMKAGTLNKITYSTGGYTEFEFEANTTWLSYNKYEKGNTTEYTAGMAGGDGELSQQYNLTSNGNPLTLNLINSNVGSTAYAEYPTGILTAYVGDTIEITIRPTAGPFTVILKKMTGQTSLPPGNGARLQITEWLTTQVQENVTVGGLRIKVITHNDGGSSSITTSYSYNESNGHSSGHLYGRPTYVQVVRNDFLAASGMAHQCFGNPPSSSTNFPGGCTTIPYPGAVHPYIKSPNSIRPMETSQGNHIGYNEVKVSQANNGFSIYRYYGSTKWDSVINDVAVRYINTDGSTCSLTIPNYPEAPQDNDFKRGELKYEASHDQAGSLLREKWFYHTYITNPVSTPAIMVQHAMGLPTFYELKTARKTQMTTTETVMSQTTGSLQTTNETYYESPWHNQSNRQLTTDSKGETIETKYKYAADFRVSTCDELDDGFSTYLTAVASANSAFYSPTPPDFCNDCTYPNSSEYCRYWKSRKLLQDLSIARKAYVITSKNYHNSANTNGLPYCRADAKSNADEQLKPILHLQDKYINAPIEISVWKEDKLVSATFNKYALFNSSGSEPNVYPSIQQELKTNVLLTDFAPSAVDGSSVLKDSRYTDEAALEFFKGNVVQVVPKSSVPVAYLWGYNNIFPIVKAANVDFATLKAAYDDVSGDLSLLRNHSSLTKAQISTYAYIPLIGMVSETNPNGIITYYEYDNLGRLLLIKDNNNNILKKYAYQYH